MNTRELGDLAEREAACIVSGNLDAAAVLVVIVPEAESDCIVVVGRATVGSPMPDEVTEAVLSLAAAGFGGRVPIEFKKSTVKQ